MEIFATIEQEMNSALSDFQPTTWKPMEISRIYQDSMVLASSMC